MKKSPKVPDRGNTPVEKNARSRRSSSRREQAKSPESGRYGPAARLYEVRAALEGAEGVTIYDLAERLHVSPRTALRYLHALHAAGEPLFEDDSGKRKLWALEPTAGHNTITITTGQLVALFLQRRVAGFLDETGVGADLDDVLARLEATLRKRDAALVRNLDRKIYDFNEAPRRYRGRADDVNEVVTALLREERLSCRHRGVAHGRKSFLLDPYTLLVYRKGLYVVGYSHAHGEVRDFALDSLGRVEWRRGDGFAYPDDYHPSHLVADRFGLLGGPRAHVRIFFTSRVERYVRRRHRHATQEIRRVPGGIELTMDVEGTTELKSWVLGYGDQAEVLEPPELRKAVMKELKGALARYGKKRP